MSRDNIQKITADLSQLPEPFPGSPANRVETGALEINDDWPGVFIRGDNAMHYAMSIKQALVKLEAEPNLDIHSALAISSLKSLLQLLASSRI